LQILEAERNAISQNGDPEAFNKAKRFLVTNHLNLAATVAKLHKIEDLIRQVAKVIRDCHDVVPAQLHQALQASVADRDSCHTELQKMTQLLKDAIDKDYETGVKFNAIERQIDELKSNLWMAEQDLTNTHLQQRLDALSHVKVSKLTYDQRLRLDKLVGQVTEVLNEEPGTLPHDLSITK
jgi:dGTP triphosphohydrolase